MGQQNQKTKTKKQKKKHRQKQKTNNKNQQDKLGRAAVSTVSSPGSMDSVRSGLLTTIPLDVAVGASTTAEATPGLPVAATRAARLPFGVRARPRADGARALAADGARGVSRTTAEVAAAGDIVRRGAQVQRPQGVHQPGRVRGGRSRADAASSRRCCGGPQGGTKLDVTEVIHVWHADAVVDASRCAEVVVVADLRKRRARAEGPQVGEALHPT